MTAGLAVMLVAIALVVLGVALVAFVMRAGTRTRLRANQVVPGQDTGAPIEWAGNHSPEARLHRRLRDAVAALPAAGETEGGFLEARVGLEVEAVAIDRRLVAVAALPDRVRAGPLAEVEDAVERVEDAVATFVASQATTGLGAGVDDALALVAERLAALNAARAEIEQRPLPQPGT